MKCGYSKITYSSTNSSKSPASEAGNVSEPKLMSQECAKSYARRSACFCSQSGAGDSSLLLTYLLQSRDWDRGPMRFVRLATLVFMQNDGDFVDLTQLYCVSTFKVKAVPLHAWTGPKGSRKLRFPDFVTTAQDGGKVVSITHRPPLPPGNVPGTHFC